MLRNIVSSVGVTLILAFAVSLMMSALGISPRDVDFWHTNPRSMTMRHATEFFDVTYRTNRYGLRGPEIPAKGDRLRVVHIGDSYTFGWGVEEGDSIPAQTEKRLRELLGSDRVDVINFGVPGTNPISFYNYAKNYVPKLNPDVVLVSLFKTRNTFLGHDVQPVDGHDSYIRSAVEMAARDYTPGAETKARRRWVWNFALYRFIHRAVNGIDIHYSNVEWPGPKHTVVEHRNWFAAAAAEAPQLDDGWKNIANQEMLLPETLQERILDLQITFDILGMIRDEVEKTGAKFIVLILPISWEILEQKDPAEYAIGHAREIDRRAAVLCKAKQLVCVDATDRMEQFGRGKSQAEIYFTDSHFTPASAAAFADIIAPAVIDVVKAEPGQRPAL